MLKRLPSSIVSCLKHSSSMAVILTVELLQARREAAIERSKILTEAKKNKLCSVPIFSEFLFGGQVAALQKSNSESQQESFIASSVAQMKAILLALKQCHQYVFNSTVMIATDNSSVVSYLKREGGTNSPSLCMEVWETLQWCNQKEINLLVRHISGKSNI